MWFGALWNELNFNGEKALLIFLLEIGICTLEDGMQLYAAVLYHICFAALRYQHTVHPIYYKVIGCFDLHL